MQKLTDEQLVAKTAEFRQRLANGADLDDVAVEAFARRRARPPNESSASATSTSS